MPWGRIYWHMCRRCQSKVLLSTAVGGESASHMLPALPKQSWLVTQFQPLTPHLLSLTFHSFSYLTRVATLETQRAVHLLFLPEGIWLRRSRQMLDPVIPPELTEGWVRVENTPPESCIPRPAPPTAPTSPSSPSPHSCHRHPRWYFSGSQTATQALSLFQMPSLFPTSKKCCGMSEKETELWSQAEMLSNYSCSSHHLGELGWVSYLEYFSSSVNNGDNTFLTWCLQRLNEIS